VLALSAVAIAGCGGGDAPPPASTAARATTEEVDVVERIGDGPVTTTFSDGTTRTTQPRTPSTVVDGVDDRRGIRITVRALDVGYGTIVTVERDAPLAVRRRLARTAAVSVRCELEGRPSQGFAHRTTGPRAAVRIGVLFRSDDWLEPAPGRTVPDSIRSCSLVVAPERRGSSAFSLPETPGYARVVYR
jgi:hypothetical protein